MLKINIETDNTFDVPLSFQNDIWTTNDGVCVCTEREQFSAEIYNFANWAMDRQK